MRQERWAAVDEYFEGALLGRDAALEGALAASAEARLPAIQVSPSQGKLLHLFARMLRARSILEIGTLGGYSTIWLASALPADGRLVTLEIAPKHAEVARSNLTRAGLRDRVDVRVGRALDLLPAIASAGDRFDLAFVDADKPSNADYFRWAVDLVRPGGAIIVDNVVRGGAVIDAASQDANVRGVRALVDAVALETRVSATAIQTVGSKGYDGWLVAVVAG